MGVGAHKDLGGTRAVPRQPQAPRSGEPSQNGGPTFYFTTTTLKVGIVDQC